MSSATLAQFLVYEIGIGDLMLNAVALEFVISMDELLYESLAPARAKRILRQTSGFKMKPSKTWSGLDQRAVGTLLFVFIAMAWAAVAFMRDQLDTLYRVKAAICYGDTEFVYARDAQVSVAGLIRSCTAR